jgi:hypothetical protein
MEFYDKQEEAPGPSKRQRVANVGNDKKSSYKRLFYEIIDAMNCQIANRFSEIDQLGFLPLLDCQLYAQFSVFFQKVPWTCYLKIMDSLQHGAFEK